jgi:plastocyanin
MRRRNMATLIALVAVTAMVGLVGVARAGATATIAVGNNFLSPSSKTINAGTKLRFKWAGGVRHHIVKTKGPGGDIRSPATGKPGVNLAKVLSKRGTYRFICTIHPAEMKTTVVVR